MSSDSAFTVGYDLDVPVRVHCPDDPDGSLLIALHGVGMSTRGFLREAAPCAPERAIVVYPEAPLPFEMRRESGMRQGSSWYVYTGDNDAFRESITRAEEFILRVLDRALVETGADPKRVALLGFSQGGYLAGWLGLRNASRFERLVVAGGRIKHEALDAAARAAGDLRVLCVHGADDAGVGCDAARESADSVAALGVEMTFRDYPGGHHVLRDVACQADVRTFLS